MPFLVCCLLFVVLLLLLDALNGQKVALLGVGDVSCTPVHCSLMMSLKISTKINYEYRKDVPWKSAHRHAHTRTQLQSCLCCFDKTFFISFHLESESASAEPGLPFATLSLSLSLSFYLRESRHWQRDNKHKLQLQTTHMTKFFSTLAVN